MGTAELEVRQKLSKAVDALQLEVDAAISKGGLDVLDVRGSVYGAAERARAKANMLRLRSVDSALVLGAVQARCRTYRPRSLLSASRPPLERPWN
jgi:hypothetical protein